MTSKVDRRIHHEPVLYQEIIHALRPRSPGLYVDCTLGLGGHSRGILEASIPEGRLLGLDLDPEAIAAARETLSPFSKRITLVQAAFSTLEEQVRALKWKHVQGIVIDLGASSLQLDTPERGFSFTSDGPLDMRFDPFASIKAADIVNELPRNELAELLRRYGEEKNALKVAAAIEETRPIHTTQRLASIVTKAKTGWRRSIHPATQTFQALRIAVNDELSELEHTLPQAIRVLTPGGRLAVTSFHSLEDRIVKQFFRREAQDCICPPEQPICNCTHVASIKEINRRPIRPSSEEVQRNPRSRSARLRVIERL